MHVEVYDGGAGERVERGAEVRHGCGEDGGDQKACYADRHLLDDESGEDAVGACEGGWVQPVEDVEACADQQEEGELEEDDRAAG